MKNPKLLKWFVIGAAVFTIVVSAIYLVRQKNYEQSFTVEKLKHEWASLVKQDMKFVSRGQNFAHYAVTAISDRSDTVVVQYRVPANHRKLRALLWVYDSPNDVNLSAILDQNTHAQHAAVIGYNVHENFERDERGNINSSRANLYNGLATSRREIGLLLQLMRKHQVIDSTQIFVAGQGLANTPTLGGTMERSNRIKSIGLIDFSRGMKKWQEIDKGGFATSYEFATNGLHGKPALIEPQDSPGFSWPDGGASLNGQPYTMKSVAGISETDILRNGLESALEWVVGSDTLAAPVRVDTTFTKVVKVAS